MIALIACAQHVVDAEMPRLFASPMTGCVCDCFARIACQSTRVASDYKIVLIEASMSCTRCVGINVAMCKKSGHIMCIYFEVCVLTELFSSEHRPRCFRTRSRSAWRNLKPSSRLSYLAIRFERQQNTRRAVRVYGRHHDQLLSSIQS